MGRRRLLLDSYFDDDQNDDESHQQHPPSPKHHQPLPNPNPALMPSSSSSDEFIDVPEDLSPPTASPPPPPGASSTAAPAVSYDGCPVGEFLSTMGLRLSREWLNACLVGAAGSGDVPAMAKLCFERFLVSDMNYSGAGVLPPNVHALHLVDLPGPFVLQVDEIVNMSCPLKGRYQEVPAGLKRCLKLSMTDGVQRVFGMEYRPIKDLKVFAPAGLKVVLCNVHIRHGLLMLVPEALEVLGGMVEELDAARQRLVDEVNKPPRGRRSRTGDVPSLASRATTAAWPQNRDTVSENGSYSLNTSERTSSSVCRQTTESARPHGWSSRSVAGLQRNLSTMDVFGHADRAAPQDVAPLCASREGANLVTPGTGINGSTPVVFVVPSTESTVANPSGAALDVDMHRVTAPIIREDEVSTHDSSAAVEGDVQMVDDIGHPPILSGDQEIPFLYLATLSTKWATIDEEASSVQGRVKCFLTGVKGFQFQKRQTYELRVYVDDGSLISEILVDHKVVHELIGYTPVEVTSALSSDAKRASDMKERLKQFQIFLANFEGSMLIEINPTSPVPVALEMNQGCPGSDAWLLMRRLKSLLSAHRPVRPPSSPIELSP